MGTLPLGEDDMQRAGESPAFIIDWKNILIGKEPALKTGDGESHCGFESFFFRTGS